jgi:hypothetical protein
MGRLERFLGLLECFPRSTGEDSLAARRGFHGQGRIIKVLNLKWSLI